MIVNLRDVGDTINSLLGKEVMGNSLLFRGGSINNLFSEEELPKVNCIINLRKGRDKTFNGVKQVHLPAADSVENYHTKNGRVRNWINSVMRIFEEEGTFPCLVHCAAGRDRTGVVIAMILLCIGIERQIIREEYLLSNGVDSAKNIDTAITGFGKPENYLYRPAVIDYLKLTLLNKH